MPEQKTLPEKRTPRVNRDAKPVPKKPRGHVTINTERCKGCGFCAQFCPTGVLAMSSGFNLKGYHPPIVVNASRCSGCDLCGMFCPDFAIYGTKDGDKGKGGKS